MSKRNILAAIALGSAVFAAPAIADGKETQRYTQGPSALVPSKACPSGSYGTYDAGGNFICSSSRRPTTTYRSAAPATTYRSTAPRTTYRSAAPTRTYRSTTPTRTYQSTQQTVRRAAPARVRTVSAPVRRVSAPVAPSGVSLNAATIAGFSGGVGNGIGGGFYGGGGGLIIGADRSYSGVLNAPAAAFTFNQRQQRRRGGNMGGGGGHNPGGMGSSGGCNTGCGGGMMGGGHD